MTSTPDWRLHRHDVLPSTNDACIAQAEAGAPEFLAIQARCQTRPRGSRGRVWSEAAGTLALSVLLRPRQAQPWPLIAGLALHDAFRLTPAHARAMRLKWPNDLMLEGRKLAGILIEASPTPDGGGWVVIGFGANLARAPALPDRRAACLAELGATPPADEMVDRLLASFGRRHACRSDPAQLRGEWLERAHPPGTELAVRTADGQTTGSFSSIAEDGTLLLDVRGEIRRITTGEVLFIQGA